MGSASMWDDTRHVRAALSRQFHDARKRLQAEIGRRFDPNYRVHISFVFMPPRQPDSDYVQRLRAFIARVGQEQTASAHVFRLRGMHAYLQNLRITKEMTELYKEAQALNIPIHTAAIGLSNVTSAQHGDLLKLLELLVPPAERTVGTHNPIRRESRMLVIREATASPFELLAEIFKKGTRIDHLVLESVLDDDIDSDMAELRRKWDAFASMMLSQDAPLKAVTLASMWSFHPTFIKTLDEKLEAAQASHQAEISSVVSAVRHVRLCSRAIVRLPGGATSHLVDLVHSPSVSLAVVNDEREDEWIAVEIPRYGTCDVRCIDVIDSFLVSDNGTTSTLVPRLENLEIGTWSCSSVLLVRLVRVFETTLRRLYVAGNVHGRVVHECWVEILNNCRQLEFLTISMVRVPQLDLFLQAYRTGCCRLKMLSLLDSSTSNASLRRFAHALSDASHPVAQHLEEFHYHDRRVQIEDLDTVMLAFQETLKTNCTLRYLHLAVPKRFLEIFSPSFKVFENQRLLSVPMREKTALLSVLQAASAVSLTAKRIRRETGAHPLFSRRTVKTVAMLVWSFVAIEIRREIAIVAIEEEEEE